MPEGSGRKGARMPRLLETDGVPFENKLIWLHFFIGDSHWYVAEFDGEDTFFGYVILNGDEQNAEWGYFSLEELKQVRLGLLDVQIKDGGRVRRFGEISIQL